LRQLVRAELAGALSGVEIDDRGVFAFVGGLVVADLSDVDRVVEYAEYALVGPPNAGAGASAVVVVPPSDGRRRLGLVWRCGKCPPSRAV
jgi:hypothetical protein